MNKDPYLGFEIDAEGQLLYLHADPAGLRMLAQRLEALARRSEQKGPDHLHFFSEQWGDGEICGTPQAKECHAIHHVKILCWPK